MGELFVEGSDAANALAYALVTNPPAMKEGRAQYSMICATDGGILDDLIVYRLGPERFLVVANASNAPVVSDALAERLKNFKAVLDDRSLAMALVAIQGPHSVDILSAITDIDLGSLRYYAIAEGSVAGIPSLVARTAIPVRRFGCWEKARAHDLWNELQRRLRPRPRACGSRAPTRSAWRRHALYGNDLKGGEPVRGGQGGRKSTSRATWRRAALERLTETVPRSNSSGSVGAADPRPGSGHAGERRTGCDDGTRSRRSARPKHGLRRA